MKKIFFLKQYSRIALLLFFCIGVFSISFAQDTFTEIKGTVKSNDSNDKLIFADINILNTNISTITNNEGEFLLKIPSDLQSPILKVSYLGYKDKTVSLSDFKALKRSTIYLDPEATQLSQVNITTIKDAKALVQAMLSKKGKNYSNTQNIMTAFYRETIKKRRKNASLSEAVVDIYKEPYTSGKNDKVDLIKARKSVDYSKLDTLAVKLLGGPFSALYTDLVKYQEFIFTEEELKNYNFNFDTATKINNRDVYVVNFEQKPEIIYPLYFGKLYIDAESFALASASYNLNVSDSYMASKLFVKKKPKRVRVWPTKASYRVDYRTKDGLWYYGYSNVALTFKVKWKQKLFNSVYTLNSEMAVTDWENNTNYKKPKSPLKPTMILSEEATGFSDPDFWGKYNIIEPEKSIESAIKKIKKKLKKDS